MRTVVILASVVLLVLTVKLMLSKDYAQYLENFQIPRETESGAGKPGEAATEPSRLASLVGQPAPDLRNIKGWVNTRPLVLAELRGKAVLLDFWSIRSRDASCWELAKLQTEYGERGLVILVVYGDRVNSVKEMVDEISAGPISWRFMERKIGKFAIALDGGGPTLVEGTTYRAPGATTAAYGIRFCPTTLLIDRAGRIAKVIELDLERPQEVRSDIERLLGLATPRPILETAISKPDSLIVRLVDPANRPVPGARVGTWGVWGDLTRVESPRIFVPRVPRMDGGYDRGPRSDENGCVVVSGASLFDGASEERTCLYALDKVGLLSGITEIAPGDLDRVSELVLRPACRVHGTVTSSVKLSSAEVSVRRGEHRLAEHASRTMSFEFYLPPGEYTLVATGERSDSATNPAAVMRTIKVEPGHRNLSMDLDLPIKPVAVGGTSTPKARSHNQPRTEQPPTANPYPSDWFWGLPDQRVTQDALIGQPMPALNLSDWFNGDLKRGDLEGKIVVLDFWTTWCGPCKAAMPHMVELYNTYKQEGVLVVGICGSTGQDAMRKVLELTKVNYPCARDSTQEMAQAWKVMWWPTYGVVDRKGMVRAVGLKTGKIEEVIKSLLADEKHEN